MSEQTIDLSIMGREDLEKLRKSELLDIISILHGELTRRAKLPSDVELIRMKAELDGANREVIRLKTKYEGRIGLGANRNPKA